VYGSGGGPSGEDPTLVSYERMADLVRAGLIAAGPPTSVSPLLFTRQDGKSELGDPYFSWESANGWSSLHGVPSGATITKVVVLLGGYLGSGRTDVLVHLGGVAPDATLDYAIDAATMSRSCPLRRQFGIVSRDGAARPERPNLTPGAECDW
jgi:hypothetical protein